MVSLIQTYHFSLTVGALLPGEASADYSLANQVNLLGPTPFSRVRFHCRVITSSPLWEQISLLPDGVISFL